MAADEVFYAAAERRIEYVTLGIGAVGAVCAIIFWSVRAGAGVALGATFSWLNYRWIKHGVDTLARLSRRQEGGAKAEVPRGTYVKFLGRYALLILAAYVILSHFDLLVTSLLAGFAAVVVAVLIETVGQLFRSNKIPNEGS